MKIKLSKRTVVLFVICCTLLIAGTVGYFCYEHRDVLLDMESDSTIIELQKNANTAISGYDYYVAIIDVLKTPADGEEFSSQEAFSRARKDSYQSYMYRDSLDNDLYQCWYYDKEEEIYPTYIYSDDVESWVETSMSEPQVVIDGWTLFDDLSYYEVSDETGIWEDTGDECYILQAVNTSVINAQIYEEVYIRKSDSLPMGILTYGAVEVEATKSTEEVVDGNEVEITTAAHDEILQKISITYSNSDLRLFDIPEEFISEEEYGERMGLLNIEEE